MQKLTETGLLGLLFYGTKGNSMGSPSVPGFYTACGTGTLLGTKCSLSLLGRLSKVGDLGQDLAIPQFLDHI